MRDVLVRDIYTVDTISKGNAKAWVKLMAYMKDVPDDEEVMFDFKGIEVIQPWVTQEFKKFMQDKRVHMKLWSSDVTVNTINIMCTLNGFRENRAINVEMEVKKTLTQEEKKIISVANDLQMYFDGSDPENVVFNIHKRFDQIGVPITVKYAEAAMKQYAEQHGTKKMKLEARGITIQPSVIEHVTGLIKKLGEVGVALEINSDDKEVMTKVGMYSSLGDNKVVADADKLKIIKAQLSPGKVGMLMRYKDSKAVDEFGRSGKGKPINCRVAIFLGIKDDDGEPKAVFRTYSGNTFYTRVHWSLEHDGELLREMETQTVEITMKEFGMYNDFLGSKFHLITPVQVRESDTVVMYDIDEDGKVTHTYATIPERIKMVFDNWDIEYDVEGVESYIAKTKELLG